MRATTLRASGRQRLLAPRCRLNPLPSFYRRRSSGSSCSHTPWRLPRQTARGPAGVDGVAFAERSVAASNIEAYSSVKTLQAATRDRPRPTINTSGLAPLPGCPTSEPAS
jgi:hypothetical protein